MSGLGSACIFPDADALDQRSTFKDVDRRASAVDDFGPLDGLIYGRLYAVRCGKLMRSEHFCPGDALSHKQSAEAGHSAFPVCLDLDQGVLASPTGFAPP